MLILLDLSVAFDMVNHNLLILPTTTTTGICGTVLPMAMPISPRLETKTGIWGDSMVTAPTCVQDPSGVIFPLKKIESLLLKP